MPAALVTLMLSVRPLNRSWVIWRPLTKLPLQSRPTWLHEDGLTFFVAFFVTHANS